jgi:hypothetical protein
MKDMRLRVFQEPEIVFALNEGKDELVKIIREANENFFETSASGTISSTTTPNASTITLPADFSRLRNIRATSSGMEDVIFQYMNQSDYRFRQALLDGGSFGSGGGILYYDFQGLGTMILAPGADMDMTYTMDYIQTVSDMSLPTDEPTQIPAEHHGFIVTWAVVECMRKVEDARLDQYQSKLEYQKESVVAVNMQSHIILSPSDNCGSTISGTMGTSLPTPDNDVVAAIITVETADVTMRWDGEVPTNTGVDGSMLMQMDSVWEVYGRDILVGMKFVPVSGDAFITAAYLKGQ